MTDESTSGTGSCKMGRIIRASRNTPIRACPLPHGSIGSIYGIKIKLSKGVNVEGGEDHEEGKNHDDNLAPFLEFATQDNGVEAALLENGSAVLMMMTVLMF